MGGRIGPGRLGILIAVGTTAVVGLGARPAAAGARRSYRVASGDSLWKIARTVNCTVSDLQRANRLDSNFIRPGQRLRIPSCQARDGRVWVATSQKSIPAEILAPVPDQSIGRPQDGRLSRGVRMPRDRSSYYLRRPYRAWGTSNTVQQVTTAIRRVRTRFPGIHALAIGDLSAQEGGPITMHGSHQSGRDADIGFYFKRRPRGYPDSFVVATARNLHFPASWALLSAFLDTVDRPGGVERIYMSYSTQRFFFRLALDHGIPRDRLEEWFQYPYGPGTAHGIIRHEPEHDEHIHVRFRCVDTDPECE